MVKHLFFTLCLLTGVTTVGLAQSSPVRFQVLDSLTQQPLVGVTVRTTKAPVVGNVTDVSGIAKLTLPDGPATLQVSLVGYTTKTLTLAIPGGSPDSAFVVRLATAEDVLEEVTVTSTRTNSRIEDLPIKVEVLGQEDMDEEAAVVPGNVGSILGDISIIHIQRTSLATNNQGVRMQGLDPKYTQILRDGLPLYEGFSGNLGVLQIPPLDLKQVEIVKGSASTLYGGGAIGGLINLVSRKPGAEPELTVVANRSTLRESNLNVYGSKQFTPTFGATLFAGYTDQPAVDVNGDGLSDVPLIEQFTIHPRLFYTPNASNRINVGYALVTEERDGGFVSEIGTVPNGTNPYFQTNALLRHTGDVTYDHTFGENHTLTVRGTVSTFNRKQNDGGFRFDASQFSGYAEASDYLHHGAHTMVTGINLTTEQFTKGFTDGSPLTDFTYNTVGAFVQDDYAIAKGITLQGGLRLDHHNVFGDFFLPRLSVLTKPSEHWTIRTSIGTGYKTPNVFANVVTGEQAASTRYRNLLPLAPNIRPERSLGLNMDVAYRGNIGEHVSIQLDQAFFYTYVSDPVVALLAPQTNPTPPVRPLTELRNAPFNYRSLGTDTYLRMEYDNLAFYLGYNHTEARRVDSGAETYIPFNPRDKFSLTVAYDIEGKWRMGIESSWVGSQHLYNNQPVPNYYFWALAVERMFGPLHIILNAENLFNVQQINLTGPVYSGDVRNPSFAPLWAPQEGRIVNLALKYQLHH